MFSSLFSSKNKEASRQENTTPTTMISRMKGFASKVSMILGLTAASQVAVSAPTAPEMPSFNQELVAMSDTSVLHTITSQTTLPPKAPLLPEQKITPIEPISAPSKLRLAIPQKGETMDIFMMRNFGTTEGIHLLVEKDTGRKPTTRSLIAGKMYVLARTEQEALSLAGIFKKQSAKKTPIIETQVESRGVAISKKRQKPTINWRWGIASGKEIVENARNFLDMTYGLWGNGINKIDCSGLINQSMKLSGIIGDSAPRYVSGDFKSIIQKMGKKSPKDVKEGDLIYTPPRRRGGYGHVMMVSGAFKDGKIPVIQASSSHGAVVESEVRYTANMTIGTPPWVEGAQIYADASEKVDSKILVASHTPSKDKSITLENTKQSIITETRTSSKEEEKVMVATVSANDERFEQKAIQSSLNIASVHGIQIEEKVAPITQTEVSRPLPEAIELASVGEVKNVVRSIIEDGSPIIDKATNESIGKQYQKDALKSLQKYTGSVRKEILDQFSGFKQATDFISYYKWNIEKYESLKTQGTSTERAAAEKILPGLYELLAKIELKIIMASNDDNISQRRAA